MSQFKQGCGANFATDAKVPFNVREIVSNYGSEYKTTGGARNRNQNAGAMEDDIEKFLETIVDNRVLDVYLKYLGITLLTPATLVPIALIMGKNVFEQVVKDIKKNEKEIQQGGEGFLDIQIPILDDEIVGTGLKLAGITALTVSPYTLVPLGILMYVYALFEEEKAAAAQQGGFPNNNLDTPQSRSSEFSQHAEPVSKNDIQMPYQKGGLDKISFGNNWDKGHCRQPNLDWTDKGNTFAYNGGKKNNKRNNNNEQRGGTGYPLGPDVPINYGQALTNMWSGEPWTMTRYVDYINDDMQLRTGLNAIPPQPVYKAPYHQQIPTYVEKPTAALCGMTENCGIPNSMAGGCGGCSELKNNNKHSNRNRNNNHNSNRNRNNKNGGGSDWLAVHNSAGPINTYPMSAEQLAIFNKSAAYIQNRCQ
jgi:hypothetical protein